MPRMWSGWKIQTVILPIVTWGSLSYGGDPQVGAQKPAALLALEQSRKAVVSGRIEWCVLPEGNEERAMSYVSRFARNGDTLFEIRGDPEGWTMFDPQTGKGRSKYPILNMANADGYWNHWQTTLSCSWWKADGSPNPWADEVKEIRAVGVYPWSNSLRSDHGLASLWEGIPGRELVSWDQVLEDGLYVVTASFRRGPPIQWYIDPGRGWNATRVSVPGEHGAPGVAVTCELKKCGDVWLPETTTYRAGDRVTEIIRIRSARVNQPDDPPCFSGADLGMEAGSNIALQNVPVEVGKPPVWNGEAVSDWDSWIDDVRSGRRRPGPMMERCSRGEPFDSPYMTDEERARRKIGERDLSVGSALKRHESMWLRYVRQFIKRYQLNEAQGEKAMQILHDCQNRAEQYLARRGTEISGLLAQVEEARRHKKPDQLRELTARAETLRKPIDEIFEQQLKPRLEKLPTRAQRKAAGESTSRPSADATKP